MELTAAEQAVKEAVHRLAVEDIQPKAHEADRTSTFPEEIWDELAALDLTGMAIPSSYEGAEATARTEAIVSEEVAYGSLAVATALSVHTLASRCIATHGSTAICEKWLPEMATGRPVGAFALSEPQAGSDPAAMSTVARREGDRYVLNGQKQWITNGERAGIYVVFARVDPTDRDSVTQFLVPRETAGLSVGPPEQKLGLRASDTTPLEFDNVHIPVDNRLTSEGAGLSAAYRALNGGRISIAAQAVGLARAARDLTIEHLSTREQFGGSLADIQTIRHRIAEMETRLRAATLLVRDAASRLEADESVRAAASMAKWFASDTAMWVTNQAVQLHGGYGYMKESQVERLYRDAKVTEIYEGTTQIQKGIIADTVLSEDST